MSRGVRLSCCSTVASAQVDPQLARLALDNLLLNAIQAAPTHSSVEMRAEEEAGQLSLSVRDTGVGPPADIRERLFEPFVTGRTDGTGLGLSIVREVAEAHRGCVRYRHDDAGTVFEMILPCQPS